MAEIRKCIRLIPVMLVSIFMGCCGQSQEQPVAADSPETSTNGEVWNFDDDEPGSLPAGFTVAETNGKGTPATWEVVEDATAQTRPKAVAIISNPNEGGTYNLLVAEGPVYQDLILEVQVKAVEGVEDQGGGPVWRYRDPNNYYIARWNPLEDNFRLYHVKEGKRKQLASIDITLDSGAWHTIRIEQTGNAIQVRIDDVDPLRIEDDTFQGAGRIGLWVKADGLTKFDHIKVTRLD